MASVLLGKRLRRHIRSKVWPVLEEVGFVEFAPLRAYRIGEKTIDVVEFVTFGNEWREPRWMGGDVRANGATFALHVGSYYPEVDRLPWAAPRDGRPKAHECHRAARLAHESADSDVDGRNFWPGAKGERLDEVIEEAVRVLRTRGLSYLEDYDPDAWLAAHDRKEARHPGPEEAPALTPAEAAEALRIAREGRAARDKALSTLHARLHLADEHITDANPCGDVLAGLLVGRGRIEDALKCLDDAKRERLLKAA